jgi:hypothetical protein
MKYILKKIAMYGNNTVGVYKDMEAAVAAKVDLQAMTYDEYFIEIIPVESNYRITGLGA